MENSEQLARTQRALKYKDSKKMLSRVKKRGWVQAIAVLLRSSTKHATGTEMTTTEELGQ